MEPRWLVVPVGERTAPVANGGMMFALVVRNRFRIKTAIVLGLILAVAIVMAIHVDAVALAGPGIGGTY